MGAPTRASAASGKGLGSRRPQKDVAAGAEGASAASSVTRLVLPTLSEVIDDIGMGFAQLRASVLGGGVFFADGAELLLISSVAQAVTTEWNLSHYERGLVVTIVFVGILVGNLISGPLGDTFGRRELINLSYLGIFVFSIMSSYSTTYWSLVIVRLFVGASFGVGQPAWNALGAEITPVSHRIVMSCVSQSLFSFGEMYSAILIMANDPNMRDLDWRWLLLVGALPSLVFGVMALLFLHQSPSYLALHGRYEEATYVLKSMRWDNGSGGASVAFQVRPQVTTDRSMFGMVRRQFNIVFSKRLRLSTCIVVYSCFVLNMVFYGCLYAFPQVLPDVFGTDSGRSPAAELLVGAAWELPGLILGFILGTTMPRKLVIKLYAGVVALSLLFFSTACSFCKPRPDEDDKAFLVLIQVCLRGGYYGVKCFVEVGFVVVYQYSIEIYPVEARVTGTAFNLAGGRLAGILAPLWFEFMGLTFGRCSFFLSCGILAAINVFLVDLLPYETSGKNAQECEHHHESDDSPQAAEESEGAAMPSAT